MHHHTKTSVAAPFTVAGLMALLTTPEATAQERIPLETIGAVRMARFEEVRGANPELRLMQAAPACEPTVGHTAKAQ
ncbi:hypothetical protein [Methylobacterium sp. Leaf93]|uniref:hypothetical protein n=1 Tax=Methylobacterium sp. Leaf93 TaxID=1736249 RepID=UPI0007014274|nr:hypothetical protein [Methylobacterium sp. Leaf93]KQP09171.1 hypothetical protein ASF26_03765 [Methylobacterium sp. Leaf93]